MDGSRTKKLREVLEAPQDEIVLVGTKKEESGKTEAAIHEVPEFTGGVNGSEAAIHEVPEFTGSVNGSEAAVHRVPNFEGGVPGGAAPIHQVPGFAGGVNGSEAAIHEVATHKDEQSHVAQAISPDKTYQAPANRQNILPETGAKETATLASLGAVGALLGLAAMGRKKEDE